ncbi:MAG: hypothetical protein P9M11_03925 [Candidatus Tenebribacter burtonii]|jgi:hypothetical protein|nr:hypothetical protein [Candidatus Tenebribacter burtonii]
MKSNKFFLLFILLLFVTNCAFLVKSVDNDKEKLLSSHFKFWENIRIDGIIKANYKNFAFRKGITIKKNNSAFRIDIYDSGIFGMRSTPFISAYYDSVLTIRTPDQKIEQFKPESKEEIDLSFFFQLTDLFAMKDEIIMNHKVTIDDVTIIFSDEMKIIEISKGKSSSKITFNYLQDLNSITFQKEEKEIIYIQIDKITHPNEEINKLK